MSTALEHICAIKKSEKKHLFHRLITGKRRQEERTIVGVIGTICNHELDIATENRRLPCCIRIAPKESSIRVGGSPCRFPRSRWGTWGGEWIRSEIAIFSGNYRLPDCPIAICTIICIPFSCSSLGWSRLLFWWSCHVSAIWLLHYAIMIHSGSMFSLSWLYSLLFFHSFFRMSTVWLHSFCIEKGVDAF